MATKTAGLKRPVDSFHRAQRGSASRWHDLAFPDTWLLVAWFSLIAAGLVAVTSASMPEAADNGQSYYYYLQRQLVFVAVGLMAAYICFSVSIRQWIKLSRSMIVIAGLLLVVIHIPGVGAEVNGSVRWLNLLVVKFQVGELVKLAIVLYVASFLDRNSRGLDRSWSPVIRLLILTAVFAAALLIQPDFGTTAVVTATIFGMMFLGGVNLKRLLIVVSLGIIAMVALLVAAPYRRERLATFMDPWEQKYDSGYQLVQSLIAVGNGRLQGLGLGQSIQKHQFLPEAHTDFIFAIIAEETGLIGCMVIILLFALLVWRIFVTAMIAESVRKRFASLVAYGVGMWIAMQALVNIGVTVGALPTKGLTLPFISYGGSSIVIMMMAMGIVCRIDAESRYLARREGII
ncbi:putative lipid II flippase FtsW [Cardiobacteriaceae bacterium TAE3-ERU3]|nr:putative lipid II flippase FtsW [Cardiobacteriaceae bacterium TAE3-ERU3]